MAVLLLPERRVDLAPFEQFLVGSDVEELAALQNENGVGFTSDDRRWEMTIDRAPLAMRLMLALTIASLSGSSALVASSRIRMRGSTISARAMARRWRWPPERLGEPS